MAATKSQGTNFTLFMVGITSICAGVAFFATGGGKLALAVGVILMAIALAGLFKIKPLEGKTAATAQPAVMKLAGVVVVLGGWLFVLICLHLTSGVGVRLLTSIVGFAISFAGICFVLAPAVNKNAIWKS